MEDAGFNPNWSRSSHGQDKSIARIFAYMRHGYFVDLGANHAEFDSNTFALERRMNWTGLCVEPNPRYWAGYEGRTCQVFKAVVGRNDGDEVPFALWHQNSGIVGEHFDNLWSSSNVLLWQMQALVLKAARWSPLSSGYAQGL